jgi:hypothetical protein
MRYFVWVDFKYEMLALFLGVVALILVYIAWASYPKRRKAKAPEKIQEGSGHELKAGGDIEKNPVAPFLTFIYIVIPIWSILYMIYYWTSGSKV